jgi:hypothetical protein
MKTAISDKWFLFPKRVWFAKTSAGTKNGTVLGKVSLSTNLTSTQHEHSGGEGIRVRVQRANTY